MDRTGVLLERAIVEDSGPSAGSDIEDYCRGSVSEGTKWCIVRDYTVASHRTKLNIQPGLYVIAHHSRG